MRTLLGLLFISVAGALLVMAAFVSVLVQLLPYVLLIALVVVVVRARRGRRVPAPIAARAALPPPPRPGAYGTARAASTRPLGAAAPPQPGWAWMPVWVGPPPAARPASPVIDAEVIEDDHRG